MSTRTIVNGIVLIALIAVAFAFAAPVRAQSCVGATHGAFANVNGNFGWLGALGGTPGYHGGVGMDPGATGYNNSSAGSTCLGN